VAVLEPVSGTRVSLRGDEEFMAASIGKLPTLAALYRAAARGEIDLDEEISLLPDDIQAYDSGGLNGFSLDYSMSLRECAYRLVNYSDNTAWTMLDRRLGEEKIRAELESAGIENSSYSGYLSGYYTTPSDVLLLLEKISDPQYTSEELSAEMLDAMTETSVEDRIPEKLPQDVRVAHKTGSYDDNFGDAGIVFYRDYRGDEKRYYLVVLASGTGEYEARDAIQEMSLALYETLLYPS
jgi:beta-lactamase class A